MQISQKLDFGYWCKVVLFYVNCQFKDVLFIQQCVDYLVCVKLLLQFLCYVINVVFQVYIFVYYDDIGVGQYQICYCLVDQFGYDLRFVYGVQVRVKSFGLCGFRWFVGWCVMVFGRDQGFYYIVGSFQMWLCDDFVCDSGYVFVGVLIDFEVVVWCGCVLFFE